MEKWRFIKVKRRKWAGHSSLGWVSQVRSLRSSESSQFLLSWPCCYQPPRRDAGSQSYLRSRVLSSAEGLWVFRWMIIAVPALSWKSPFIWRPGGNARLDKLAEEGFDCFALIHDLSVHREDGLPLHEMQKAFYPFLVFLLWPLVTILKGTTLKAARSFLSMVFGASI